MNIREKSQSMDFGSEIHNYAKRILNKEPFFCDEKIKPFVENTIILIEKIKEKYPLIEKVEYPFSYPLKDLGFDSDLQFSGRIDAIFRNEDEYLIVDWKSNKSYENNSEYRQQLEAYKKVYSLKEKIPYEKIKVALGYVGLRTAINTGKIDYYLDERQPQKTAFETLSKKINVILSWINNVDLFFEDFIKTKEDNFLWKSIVEEIKKEK
ncbi:MAG: PD-(D/E)XK nuclease family protein [Candidatus Woesearchaeota archaeon]